MLASLLLLNMLIAMMAHSYDEVLEEARATYYFRLAQTSATYDRVPLPMLYLLRVPWELGVVCNPWLSEARRSRLLGEVAQVTAPDSRPGLDCPFEYYSLPSSAVHCQPLPLIATYCHRRIGEVAQEAAERRERADTTAARSPTAALDEKAPLYQLTKEERERAARLRAQIKERRGIGGLQDLHDRLVAELRKQQPRASQGGTSGAVAMMNAVV